ncbi:hypothetical protein HJC23_002891 [Cyclotella cryptica]|uniref:Uncharacterized protein n=1 Tax=Cyclotella cryptica TaxID=29204 RepID=A0ABD3PKS2_9STRA|eukprot:CCRYP_014111-RA/>CCRYP_014111-RA protein AED:0.01 eAED:0.01 QI:0/-1/0/1/-1/1/1/0/264
MSLSRLLLALAVLSACHHFATAFSTYTSRHLSLPPSSSSALDAKSALRKQWSNRERNSILDRNGEYFTLDRFSGKVQFGSSSTIRTPLDGASKPLIEKWLSNDKAIALSIWDEKLITEVDPQVYRLKLMTLMFVTIQLAPHVDVRMWTDKSYNSGESNTVFKLESVGFDPNIQILPGVGVNADSLGILIDVVGELYPSKDGRAVEGKIGFVTSGELPPPMRLLPEPALRGSLSTINRTITNFAVKSFKDGARKKFADFLLEEAT